MPDIEIRGHRLDYRQLAPVRAGAPTIVFLHEGLGSQEQWRAFPDRLAAATGCGAFVYSRWGYGRSEGRPRPWPVEFMHDEGVLTLPALLETFGIQQPILFGHSDGGTIALLCAAHHPTLVRGVVSEAAHVLVDELTVRGLRQTHTRAADASFRQRLARHHGANTDTVLHGWLDAWLSPEGLAWTMEPDLARITCPVMAIQGRADHYGTPRQVEVIASSVRGPAQAWLIDHCGHAPHAERPDEVLARTSAFIAGLATRG